MLKEKPRLGLLGLWNISFGFFGIQAAFALQNANVSRIFQTLGASIDDLPILWIAGPVTGLVVQPIIGHFSDRTWSRFGRRRPYFLAGAILCAIALFAMPHASALWVAACLLWMLDASVNISMEPFRAFVGDMLGSGQRTAGYAFQTMFIGTGAVAASLLPEIFAHFGFRNVAPGGGIPDTVRYAFYCGGFALLAAVLWTVLSTREYSPEQLAAFGEESAAHDRDMLAAPPSAHGPVWLALGLLIALGVWHFALDKPLYILGFGLAAFGLAQIANKSLLARGTRPGALSHILADLAAMPATMRRLAVIQFLSWVALFILWIYSTPIVTRYQFEATDTASALYNEGANHVGVLFAVYNGVAALYAFLIPLIGARIGTPRLHAINLLAGGAAFASFALIRDPQMLYLPMIGIGMAWASILTIPYAILADALPQAKLGVYMGLFNIFIVLPQLIVATVMGALARSLYPTEPIVSFLIAAGFMTAAAFASLHLHTRQAGDRRRAIPSAPGTAMPKR